MDMMWSLARLPYADRWRRGRKLLHAHVHQGVAHRYHPIQLASARRFARDILSVQPDKEALATAIRANFGRTIIKIVYGIDAPDAESEYIALAEQVIRHAVQAAAPGRFLVDSWPIREWQTQVSARVTLTL
jgi:cytochrome P450